MRRARQKLPRIRVIKPKPRRISGNHNKIYDEDVLRWRRMFGDAEALAAAQLAGHNSPGLSPCSNVPVRSPEAQGSNAMQYVSTLTEDARHALFKHCGMVARHERLLLEGQERLKFVQKEVHDMMARMPSPASGSLPREGRETGPQITTEPIPDPSCWASCCGMFPLPKLPALSPPPGPQFLRLPDSSYFMESARKNVAAKKRSEQEPQQQLQGMDQESGPAICDEGPVSYSNGVSCQHSRFVDSLSASVLGDSSPGRFEETEAQENKAEVEMATVAATFTPSSPLPLLALPPLSRKGSGTPESVLRPLSRPASLAAVTEMMSLSRGDSAVPGLPALLMLEATGVCGGHAALPTVLDGRGTGALIGETMETSQRYQDPESIRYITLIQAIHRGRMARRLAAGMRAQQQPA